MASFYWCRGCGITYGSEQEALECSARGHGPRAGMVGTVDLNDGIPVAALGKLTGGESDYYKAVVARPTHLAEPYVAECNDIIEALGMTFAEGEAFKALWRHAIVRQGRGKPGSTPLYEAEKARFFSERLVALAS